MKTKQKIVKSVVILLLLGLFVSTSVIQFTATARPGIGVGATGTVKSSSNGAPISGAKVTLYAHSVVQDIDYTDSGGNYRVDYKGLLMGPLPAQLRVEKTGFITAYISITLQPFTMITKNILLDAVPPPPQPRSVTYAGTVMDHIGEIVSEATVKLKENGNVVATTTAAIDGTYAINFDIWPDRDYDLVASKDGYETTTVDVPIIEEGQTHYENFYMTNFPQKYAVIACIEDYQYPSHAFRNYFAYKDSNRWYHRFTDSYEDGGYNYDPANVIVLSDVENAQWYEGRLPNHVAYENTIKLYLNLFVGKADWNDIVSFIFSGTAYNVMDGEDVVSTYLCTYEYQEGVAGYLYDSEIAAIFDQSQAATNFIFLDVSHAGGFVAEIEGMTSYPQTHFLGASDTLGEKHWEYSAYWETGDGSLWTYWFLEAAPFSGGTPPNGVVRDIHSLYLDGRTLWLTYVGNNLLGVYPPITEGYIPLEDKPIFRRGYDYLYLDLDWVYL